MKIITLFLMLITLDLSLVFGGEIYGTIRDQGRPIREGVKVEIVIKTRPYETKTDNNGSFSIFIEEKGECELRVYYNGQTPSIVVYSYQDSIRYDLVLERRDGTYYLKRG